MYVTGTFDDWQKSEKLEKNGDVFSKDVTLKSADEKIYYKVRNNGETREGPIDLFFCISTYPGHYYDF